MNYKYETEHFVIIVEVKDTPGVDLSPREEEVLQLVAQGTPNKKIADSLFISKNTVRAHLRSIMDKTHLVNRTQVAVYAISRGLISYIES